MAVVEISVLPVGTKTASLSRFVAGALRVLQAQKDVMFELTPMGTVLEGDLDEVLALARKMHESVFGDEVTRVVTTIKIDDRRDKTGSMSGKVESVRRLLQRSSQCKVQEAK